MAAGRTFRDFGPVKAALSHVQFETIHPFLDGNGRVGRLLITLILYSESVLRKPSLYLSLYFKANRQHYYDLLQRVRLKGEWEAWLAFFFTAIQKTAEQAVQTIQTIQQLFQQDEANLLTQRHVSKSVITVYRYLQKRPILSIAHGVKALDSTVPTVTKAMEQLIALNLVKELTGQERNRLFSYAAYVQILSEGADPIVY